MKNNYCTNYKKMTKERLQKEIERLQELNVNEAITQTEDRQTLTRLIYARKLKARKVNQ